MAGVKGLNIAAMLHAKLSDLLPVVLFLQMQRVLQVVNLSLEVKAHFLHAGFQGTHLLLLQLDDLLLLETDEGTDDLIRGKLHRGTDFPCFGWRIAWGRVSALRARWGRGQLA